MSSGELDINTRWQNRVKVPPADSQKVINTMQLHVGSNGVQYKDLTQEV